MYTCKEFCKAMVLNQGPIRGPKMTFIDDKLFKIRQNNKHYDKLKGLKINDILSWIHEITGF